MTENKLHDQEKLGSAPITKLIIKFAIPAIITSLVNYVYNITDQIFIGNNVGMLGNAAVSVIFPLLHFCTALTQLIGTGACANFNISQGAKDGNAKYYVGGGLTLAAIVSIGWGILIFFLRSPALVLCGVSENVFPFAETYLKITAIGYPFLIFSNVCSFLIRSDGSPRYSMVASVSGTVINLGLDALLMYVFHLGIAGAAWATTISQIVSCVICVVYLPRFKTIKITREIFVLRGKYILNIVRLGLSDFLNQIVMMIVNMFLNNQMVKYGALSSYGSDIPLAVSGVVNKLTSILSAISVGLSLGAQPIYSYNIGAKNYKRTKKTYLVSAGASLAVCMVAFIILRIFPTQMLSIFGASSDPLYQEFGVRYIKTYLLFVFLFGIQPLTVHFFASVGNVKKGVILSIARQGLILLPLILIFPAIWGMDGLLWAGAASDLIAFIVTSILVLTEFKRFDKLEKLNM